MSNIDFTQFPMVSWSDLASLSGEQITKSEVVAVRWLGCLSSRIPSIEQMINWELREAPEVPAEFFPKHLTTMLGVWPGAMGLVIDQEFTRLRKAYCTDCYSELVDDWYQPEDENGDEIRLPVPRLMPDGLDYEDEGLGQCYWPGWGTAKAVYDEIPFAERDDDFGTTEGFFTRPSYSAIVVAVGENGSVYMDETMLDAVRRFMDEGLPLYTVRARKDYDEDHESDLLV